MKITYTIKSVYGTEYNYPVSDDAKMVSRLTGRKTLSAADLSILKEAGHDIERVMT